MDFCYQVAAIIYGYVWPDLDYLSQECVVVLFGFSFVCINRDTLFCKCGNNIIEEIEIEEDTYFSAEATNRVGSEPGSRGVWFKQSKGVYSGPSDTMPF